MKLRKNITPLTNKDSGVLGVSETDEGCEASSISAKTAKIRNLSSNFLNNNNNNNNNENSDKCIVQTFKAKYFGSTFVRESRGDSVCEKSLGLLKAQLLASKAHKKRIRIRVDVGEIYVVGARSSTRCHVHKLENITFIWTDPCDIQACGIIVKQPLLGDNIHEFYGYKINQNIAKLMGILKQRFQNLEMPYLSNNQEQTENEAVGQKNNKSAEESEMKLSFDLIRLDDWDDADDNLQQTNRANISKSNSSSSSSSSSSSGSNDSNNMEKNQSHINSTDHGCDKMKIKPNDWIAFDDKSNDDPWSQYSQHQQSTSPTTNRAYSFSSQFSPTPFGTNTLPWSSIPNSTANPSWSFTNQNNNISWDVQNSVNYLPPGSVNTIFQGFSQSPSWLNTQQPFTTLNNDHYTTINQAQRLTNDTGGLKNPFLIGTSLPNQNNGLSANRLTDEQSQLFDNLFDIGSYSILNKT